MDRNHSERQSIDGEVRRRVPSRALAVCLAASVAAHAAVYVLLPGYEQAPAPSRQRVLEVVVLKPEPLPAAARAPEPEAAPTPAARDSSQANDEPRRRPEIAKPLLAMAKPEVDLAGSFSVAPARIPDIAPAQPASPPAPESVAVTPPSLDAPHLKNPGAKYPDAAIRAGEQGTVLLRVLVRRDGLPLRVELEKSSGSPHLDAAARDAVWGWRFVPARQGGDPIESWYVVPVVFRLEGAS